MKRSRRRKFDTALSTQPERSSKLESTRLGHPVLGPKPIGVPDEPQAFQRGRRYSDRSWQLLGRHGGCGGDDSPWDYLEMNYQAGACSCKECQTACSNKPGWFAPSQIKPLAKKLGLTVQELFNKHLQIDWWDRYPKHVFVLSPRQTHGAGGTMFPGNPKGECHWFKKGKCSIHELGKPRECQMLGHREEEDEEKMTYNRATGEVKIPLRPISNHEAVMMTWDNPKAQKMIRDLYGAEPEAEECSFM